MIKRAATFAIALALLCFCSTSSHAAISLQIQQVGTATSDGSNPTTGFFDVFLSSDDPTADFAAPNNLLRGFQLNLQGASPTDSIVLGDITWGPVGEPLGVADAFPGTGVAPLVVTGDIGGSSAFSATPFDLTTLAANQPIGLMSSQFVVAAGQSGTFDVGFITNGPTPSLLTNGGFGNIPFQGVNGTMTITAVPEPASTVFVASLLGAGVAYRRRKRSGVKTSEVAG